MILKGRVWGLSVGCGSFPVAAGGKAGGREGRMSLFLGLVVLRAGAAWQRSQEVREDWPEQDLAETVPKLCPVGRC